MNVYLPGKGALLGGALVLGSVLWCWAAISTIPDYSGQGLLGPRGLPLVAGMLLGVLGAILALRGLLGRRPKEQAEPSSAIDLRALLSVAGLLFGYSLALQYFGFIIATAAVSAIAVGPVLGDWRWRVICGTSALLSLGIYLALGKLLGVYMPVGKLMNLAF